MANNRPGPDKDVKHGCVDCIAYKWDLKQEPCRSCDRWSNWVDKATMKGAEPMKTNATATKTAPAPTEAAKKEQVQQPAPTTAKPTEAKEEAKKTTKKEPAPKEFLTEKQKYFLRQLKSSQCQLQLDGTEAWNLDDLAVELESTINLMAMGAMVTTLTQKGVITNTKETLPDAKNGKKSRILRLTDLGRETIKTL